MIFHGKPAHTIRPIETQTWRVINSCTHLLYLRTYFGTEYYKPRCLRDKQLFRQNIGNLSLGKKMYLCRLSNMFVAIIVA